MIKTLSDQWPTEGSGYPWWPLCFHEFTSSFEPSTLSPNPFVATVLVCPRFDRRYPIYLVHPRFRQTHFLVLWCCILVTKSPACKLNWRNLTEKGPEYLSVTRMDKSRSDPYSSTYPLRNTQYTPLWLPCYGVTVDAIKASSGDSNYIWSLRSKDRVATLPSYRNVELCDRITLHNFDLGVCPPCHSPNNMTSLSTDVSVSMIRKPWSSTAQWTSILEFN